MEEEKQNSHVLSYIIYSLLIVLFISASFVLYFKSKNNVKYVNVNYNQKENVDYKVYLKPNKFFDTSYLTKSDSKTFISSLIKYIDIDFLYNISYDQSLSGQYEYYIRGTLEANKTNSETGNYWNKEYTLLDRVVKQYSNVKNINIAENVKVDYQKYNDLLNSFKSELLLSADGKFKVELIIKNTIQMEEINENKVSEIAIPIEIPLSIQSVDISIDSISNDAKKGTIDAQIEVEDSLFTLYFRISIVCAAITVLLIILFISKIIFNIKNQNKYLKELNNILSSYDSIVVNVEKSSIDLKKYNVIRVSSFEELLDAHSEVRLPINFIEIRKNRECAFILINNDMAWVYKMKNRG